MQARNLQQVGFAGLPARGTYVTRTFAPSENPRPINLDLGYRCDTYINACRPSSVSPQWYNFSLVTGVPAHPR